MQIKVWYKPAAPRTSVFLHAWDQSGGVWDLPGIPTADGKSFTFLLTGSTVDQRDVSFKYRFGASDWEDAAWTRTVPTLDATELWTLDFSARCATQAPGPPAKFDNLTVNAISSKRFKGGSVFLWTPATNGRSSPQTARDDNTNTSQFAIALDDTLRGGFYFKLVGPTGDFEENSANRFWQPSDGEQVWFKSGQPQVQSQAIVPVDVQVTFLFPPVLGTPTLRVQDLIGDFDSTLEPALPGHISAVFAKTTFTASVYTGALYNVWATTEPQSVARRFRIPVGGTDLPSITVNGYDQWLPAIPSADPQVNLVVHPNPGSAFGDSVDLQVGVGSADAHQTVAAPLAADHIWTANIGVFAGVPFWTALVGESRPDGPLNFRRGVISNGANVTLHTIDGVGGVSANAPGGFQDVAPDLRQSLMQAVYGNAIVAAGVFDPWEMPHGANTLKDTAYFVVRAPHAVNCSVLLMPTANQPGAARKVTTVPMKLTADLRYWWATVPAAQVPHGTPYRFAYSDGWELLDPAGHYGEALDPACRWAMDTGSLTVDAGSGAEQSWSLFVDLSILQATFAGSNWQTAGWNSLLIYEMHLQRFSQRNAGAKTDFDQVVTELQTGYLKRLPVTALELLPIHEFPASQAGWGYNPSLFSAIDSDYGGPEGLARMVRAAHDAGRAVVLDLVYNHMTGSPLQVLARDVYASGETVWGDMIYFAHPAACEFFRQATVYLWQTFQIDSFRFDSTETIINGGRPDASSTPYVLAKGPDGNFLIGAGKGWEFLGMLRSALHRTADATGRGWPFLAGENDPENPGMTDVNNGVLDGEWHFSAMYALQDAAKNDADKSSDIRGDLAGGDRPFQREVVYAESHDTAKIRIAAAEKFGNGLMMAKAIGAISLLAEGIPMLFMGQEAGETQPFVLGGRIGDPGFVLPLDNYEQAGSESLQVLTWFRDLIGLRNNGANGLQGDDTQTTGQGFKTVTLSRAGGEFFVIATIGLVKQQQSLVSLGLLSGSAYKEIFNSSWPQYRVHNEPEISNGGYSARLGAGDSIQLPSIGAVVLQRT